MVYTFSLDYEKLNSNRGLLEFTFLARPKPCHSNPCKNGGKCASLGSDNYRCSCTNGFSGKNCQSKLNIGNLYFKGGNTNFIQTRTNTKLE